MVSDTIGLLVHKFYDAVAFNQNIGGWDVSSVTNMESMVSKDLDGNAADVSWYLTPLACWYTSFLMLLHSIRTLVVGMCLP
jgi:surface protein